MKFSQCTFVCSKLDLNPSLYSLYRLASKMKMSKVGNQTNSQDPQAVNSRVFVGNLNTFQCSKTDVERMFQRYGRLAGKNSHLIIISSYKIKYLFSTITKRLIIGQLASTFLV